MVNSDLKPLTLSINSTIYVFKRFGPLNLLTFLGGRAASSGQLDVPVGFFYTSEPNTYRRLSEALAFLCRSLLPGLERLPKALNGFFISHATCFDLQSSTRLFGLFMSIASTPIAYSGHESSQWLFHTMYLIYANWALKFLCSGSRT